MLQSVFILMVHFMDDLPVCLTGFFKFVTYMEI